MRAIHACPPYRIDKMTRQSLTVITILPIRVLLILVPDAPDLTVLTTNEERSGPKNSPIAENRFKPYWRYNRS
jgi:hypothetical protein